MPDDRLSDVTIRHNALLGAAGTLSVHAGALTVVYTGSGPEDLMVLLTGGPPRSSSGSSSHRGSPSGSGAAGAGTAAGVLRTLRLSARSMRFVAVRGSGGEGEQRPQTAAATTATAAGGAATPTAPAGQPAPSQQRHQAGAAPEEDEVHSCSGSELFEYLTSSGWSSVWDVKLQRSMFRNQLTFSLVRRATPAGTPGLPVPATV